jgi:hypothetical protein
MVKIMADDKKESSATSTRVRDEWKAVQARKKNVAILKMFLGVAVLGAIVGVGVVFKDNILAYFQKDSAPIPKVVTKTPTEIPPPVSPGGQKTAIPPPVTNKVEKLPPPQKPIESILTVDEESAKKLIAEGKTVLESLEFEKAESLFKEVENKKCGVATRSEAKIWSHKARQFYLATKHIPPAGFASAETSYVVQMIDGSEWVGLKVDEDDKFLKLQVVNSRNPASEGRSTFPFAKKEIREAIPVSLKERQKQFLELLGALEQSGRDKIQRSSDYYDLVYLSKRLVMGRECIAYLDRAYCGGTNHPADSDLGNSMRKEVVRRALDRASLTLSSGRPKQFVEKELEEMKRKMPDFQIAADEVEAFKLEVIAKLKDDFVSTIKVKKVEPKPVVVAVKAERNNHQPEPTPPVPVPVASARELVASDDMVEVVIEDSGVKGNNAAAAALVEKANAKYQEAMSVFQKFRQGTNGDNNQILRKALDLFTACNALYEEALAKDPTNKQIESRMSEAAMNSYSCRKYQTL